MTAQEKVVRNIHTQASNIRRMRQIRMPWLHCLFSFEFQDRHKRSARGRIDSFCCLAKNHRDRNERNSREAKGAGVEDLGRKELVGNIVKTEMLVKSFEAVL